MSIGLRFVQATSIAKSIATTNFESDSWEIIKNAVSINPLAYEIGVTKVVDMGELGIHTLRVANNTTPDECGGADFSETACGFVVEFADIITTHNMNSTNTNAGGWSATEMRSYLQNDVFEKLPSDLRDVIKKIKVVSSNPSGETDNVSYDNLYLLSLHEIWRDYEEDNGLLGSPAPPQGSIVSEYDSGYNSTRQLDFYERIVEYNYGATKMYDNTAENWWLRTTNNDNTFYFVNSSGGWDNHFSLGGFDDDDPSNCKNNLGVSPAFRVA